MKKNRKLTAIYLFSALIITLAAIALRTVALNKYYNLKTGYFSEKALITVANWLIVAVVLGAVSYVFATNRKKKYVATYNDATTFIPSALVAVSLVLMAVELFRNMLKPLSGTSTAITATNFICVVLAVFAAIAFAITCVCTSRRSVTRATYQILAVLFFSVYSAYIYFGNPYPINNSVRTLDIMAYLCAAVFLLFEIRISLGRDLWHFYTAFGIITASVCAYSSIPTIIEYFISGNVVSDSIEQAVLTLSVFFFAALRLLRSLYLFEDTEAVTVQMIKKQEEAAVALAVTQDESDVASEDSEEEDENYKIELDSENE